jgi:putative aldouronate transport system substrate-binding protein
MTVRRLSSVFTLLLIASMIFAAGGGKSGEKITLSYWNSWGDNAITGGDANRTYLAQEMEKRTGIHIDFISSSSGDGAEQLRLLMASKNMPDMVADAGFNATYPGGTVQAAKDKVILTLNSYVDTYAPNYKKAYTANREYEKLVKADDGSIYAFACIRDDGINRFFGPMVRKDLLDKAGLALPETMDDWYSVLTAYKKQGISNPLTFIKWFLPYSQAFVSAYGVATGVLVNDKNEIVYGPIQPGYRQFLETFRKWYAEGLIDPDYPTLFDWGLLQTKMTTDKSAACLGFLSFLGDYLPTGRQTNPDYSLVPTKHPVAKKGMTPFLGQSDPAALKAVYVNAGGKHIPEAMKWLDYGYSKEGTMLFNFGIEGTTYTMKKGYPAYTDEILHNPKGWTVVQALSMYCDVGVGPWIQKKEYFEQIRLTNDAQKNAIGTWKAKRSVSELDNLTFTTEEQETRKLQTDIETYVDETTLQFITGMKPMTEYDAYVKQVNGMSIDRITAVYNAAWKRFQKR